MRKAQRMRVVVPLRDYCSNFLYNITHAEGMARCAAGTAAAIRDFRYGRNEIVSYRVTESAKASNSENSMLMITPAEMEANCNRSRTARLPERDTLGRDSKHARELAKDPKRPAEDFIERAQNKIKMWPIIPLANPQHVAWAARA